MIGVIVACLVAAGVITYKTRSGGSGTKVFRGQPIWVQCGNPDCGAEYQMDKAEYFDTIEALVRQNPMVMQTPALVCEKCGEESVYRAEKCPKCGTVFFRGAVGRGDFADRCPDPKCGYSESEEIRKRAIEGAK